MNDYYLLQDTVLSATYSSMLSQEIPVENITYTSPTQDSIISFSNDERIPLSVVSGKSSLESIVVYLKEYSGLKWHDIAKLLNRDQRTIWVTYANAQKKGISLKKLDVVNRSLLSLPLNIFYSRNFSILESIVLYLRSTHSLSFNQISDLIGKNYQTVVTVYKRALVKMDKIANKHGK